MRSRGRRRPGRSGGCLANVRCSSDPCRRDNPISHSKSGTVRPFCAEIPPAGGASKCSRSAPGTYSQVNARAASAKSACRRCRSRAPPPRWPRRRRGRRRRASAPAGTRRCRWAAAGNRVVVVSPSWRGVERGSFGGRTCVQIKFPAWSFGKARDTHPLSWMYATVASGLVVQYLCRGTSVCSSLPFSAWPRCVHLAPMVPQIVSTAAAILATPMVA